jgi:uncharacterized protein (TIGR02996 family)
VTATLTDDLLLDRAPNPRPPDPPSGDDALDDLAAELEAAIAADPTAPAPYAVYGDLLQERGHPLGELIAIGQELVRKPLRAAHRAHLAAHRERLLGPLAGCDLLHDVDWFMGFIRACRIAPRGQSRMSLGNDTRPRPWVDFGLVVRWLLDRPGPARFLQKLVVHLDFMDRDDALYSVCAALARCPRPTLRVLQLGNDPFPTPGLAHTNAADVWPMAPGLRELRVYHSTVTVAPMRLPALEQLGICSTARDFLVFATSAELPSLERLMVALYVGTAADFDFDVDALGAALRACRLPRLRSLAIHALTKGDALCQLLAEAPLLAQLEEVDLGWSGMSDVGAAIIHEHRAAFRHLRLRVRHQRLSPAGRALLKASVGELALGRPARTIAIGR